jgi:2-polyprenyl-3-methyl-5-hydroxy-6-metoxy-1,4-benzoquinol methylase
MFNSVTKNQFGYYSLKDIPSSEELQKYYAEKYYQEEKGSYQKTYSEEEIKYNLNKLEQKYFALKNWINLDKPHLHFLDIGCGEGWALKFFKEKSWVVNGLDYGSYGCQTHNPDCLPHLIVGDILRNIKVLIDQGQTYDCIWLDNVLEHVIDPNQLMNDCKKLINTNGILMVEVPNDFSIIQERLLEKGDICKPFWIVVPDHISYFNKDGLISLGNTTGWNCVDVLGDFPIDFNIFNPNTNYIKDRAKGKASHLARVEIENLMHSISIEKTNQLYRAMADLGLGRQIIAFFKIGEK